MRLLAAGPGRRLLEGEWVREGARVGGRDGGSRWVVSEGGRKGGR